MIQGEEHAMGSNADRGTNALVFKGPNKVNILVVDDKPANIVSLEAILSDSQYNVISAISGPEALKHILHHDFAVILLDVMMPDMDGFEVARFVRQRGRSEVTPIIFLTAIATEFRYLQEGYAVGAVDYLQKPLDPLIVQAKVAVFVELFRKNEKLKEQESQLREMQRMEQELRFNELKQSSERHYEELAETIPQIVFTVDPQGNAVYFNKRWFQYTGLSPAKAYSNKGRLSVIHPSDQDVFGQCWSQPRVTGESAEVEIRLREHRSGSFRWHLMRAIPEFSQQGQFLGWLGTLTEIHAHKRAQENKQILTEVSNLLAMSYEYEPALMILAERLTNTIADICIIDLALPHKDFVRIVRGKNTTSTTNPTAPQDLAKPELASWSHFSDALLSAKTLDQSKRLGALALETSQPVIANSFNDNQLWQTFSSKLNNLDGCPPLGSTVSAPIFFQGVLTGSISVINLKGPAFFEHSDLELLSELCQHITLALQKISLYEQSIENNKRKDQFLAILSHELRTPLNAVLGWTELIKADCDNPKILESLAVIERNGKVLGQLVGDLLEVSRIITGKLELNRKPIDISQVLQGIITTMTPQAEEKNITLELDMPRKLPLHSADESRLEQVFWNLLVNAIKFTPMGGRISVSATVENNVTRIIIADNGIGIAASLMPHIFERFRQADSSSTRAHAGLGLGLSIVKSIVEAHDGRVQAKSLGVGHGSSFIVELPISYQHTPVTFFTEPRREEKKSDKVLTNRMLLVVDDDWSTRTLLAKFLVNSGAIVEQAGSVKEAMEILQKFTPEVLVTDIGMPYEDGFTMLARLKQHCEQTGAMIPAAALSAYASNEDAGNALAAGFNTYLTKPIKATELIAAVFKLLPPARETRIEG